MDGAALWGGSFGVELAKSGRNPLVARSLRPITSVISCAASLQVMIGTVAGVLPA